MSTLQKLKTPFHSSAMVHFKNCCLTRKRHYRVIPQPICAINLKRSDGWVMTRLEAHNMHKERNDTRVHLFFFLFTWMLRTKTSLDLLKENFSAVLVSGLPCFSCKPCGVKK